MLELYNDISFSASKLITGSYSTSFSSAVKLLGRETRLAIYSIYGFVRFADEIVDTFHSFDRKRLLERFERDYYEAVESGISLNPVLNAFQITVKKYVIPDDLIQAFLSSMKIDLVKQKHNSREETEEYIYGSAEVVGLMCLRVFVRGDEGLYSELEKPARQLGSAFQKVNFLRDIKDDTELLNRQYFHRTITNGFNEDVKNEIITEVENEFADSIPGIIKLPYENRLGVLTAFLYYTKLLKKIKKTPAKTLLEKRIRVPDPVKLFLRLKAFLLIKTKYSTGKLMVSNRVL
ncbi:MAG: phytoene/squalene synthase family protein [Bacteroidales bacterium]|jgi:phytoene synthase